VWAGPITLQGDGLDQFYANGTAFNVTGDISGPAFTGTLFLRGTNAGSITGAVNMPGGTVSKTDNSTWTIGSVGPIYSWGNTNIAVGTLQMSAAAVLPATTLVTMGQGDANSPVLRLNGFDQTIGGLTKNAANTGIPRVVNGSATLATLTIDSTADTTYNSLIGGPGANENNLALVKAGAATFTLAAAATYTGSTSVNAGTLQLSAPAAPVVGAAVWLDASDQTTLFRDPAGFSPVMAPGDQVALWRDKSGNGRDASQTNMTRVPVWQSSPAVNTNAVLRFEPANAYFNIDLSFLLNSQYSICAVEARGDNANRYYMGTVGAATNQGMHIGYRNDTQYTLAQYGNDLNVAVPAFAGKEIRVWTNMLSGAGHSIFMNGAQLGNNGNTTGLTAVGQGQIAAGYQAAGQLYRGDLAEIIIYPTGLSVADRQTVENYLAAKWYGLLPQFSAVQVAAGATLDLNGVSQVIGSLADGVGGGGTVLLGANTLTVGGANASTSFSGAIAGTGGLTKAGTGTLTLSGNSSYSGATRIAAGRILATAANALGQGAGTTTVNRNTTLELNGAFTLANKPLSLTGTGDGGVGALYNSGGTPSVAGTIAITSGGASIGSAAGTLTIAGNVNLSLDATLTATGAGNTVIAGNISDPYSGAGYVAGLREGRLWNRQNTSASPVGYRGRTMLPAAGEKYAGGTPDALSGWGANETWIYTGQFYVPPGVTSVSFAGSIDDSWYMLFNGVLVRNWTWVGNTGVIAVTPDTWYDIDIRFENGGGGAGASANGWAGSLPDAITYPNLPWRKGFGFAYNFAVPDNNTNNYIVPIEDGSMSVFRTPLASLTPPTNSLIMAGTGTLTLTGANTYLGQTRISSGTLQVGDGVATGTLGTAGVVNDAALVFNDGADSMYNGMISGTGSLTKTGAATLTLGGANTYTGATAVVQGTLQVANTAVPAGHTALYTFDNVAGTTVYNEGPAINKNGVLTNGASTTASGLKGNAMAVALAPNNQYMGINLTYQNGAWRGIDLSGGVWTASAWFYGIHSSNTWRTLFRGNVNDHQVIIQDTGTRLGTYDNAGGGNFRPSAFDTARLFAGWHQLTAVGSGTTTDMYIDGVLAGTCDRKSATDIFGVGNHQAGGQPFAQRIDEVRIYQRALTALEVMDLFRAQASLPSASAVTVAAGATLDLNGTAQTIGSLADGVGGGGSVLLGAGSLNTGRDGTSTAFSGVISGAGGITKAGAGTFTLSGINTYGGATAISGGVLQVTGGDAIPNTSAVSLADVANVALDLLANETIGSLAGGGPSGGNVTLNANTLTTGGNAADTLYLGVISGAGGLIKEGAGALTLGGANTYAGATVINAGAIKLGGVQPGLYEGRVAGAFNTATANPNVSVQLTTRYANIADGSPGYANTQGAWQDNTTFIYSGYVNNFTGAPVTWSFAEGFDDSVLLTIDGVQYINDSAWAAPIIATLTLAPGSHPFEARFGQGGGGVGSSGGWLGFGYDRLGRDLRVAGAYTAMTDPGDGTLFSLAPRDPLRQYLPTGTAVQVAAGATLNLNGVNQTIGSLEDGVGGGGVVQLGAGTLTTGGSNVATAFSGSMLGTGGLTKTGTAAFALSGINSHTGPTTIDDGTLVVAGDANLGGAASVLTFDGGTLQFGAGFTANRPAALLAGGGTVDTNGAVAGLAGEVSGTGALLINGGGTLTLSNVNPYSGMTTVSGTTLLVNGVQPASAIQLDAGTLAGIGIAGPVSVLANPGTIISAGAPATVAGILAAGDLTLSADATLTANLDLSTVPGDGHDQLAVTGAVNLGGCVLDVQAAFTPAIGDAFVLIDNDDVDPVVGQFNGLPEGARVVASGRVYGISYVGGTGNDVVLTRTKDDVTVAVASSVNPSAAGQSVSFTATVTCATPGAPALQGTVQFAIDGVNFGAPTAVVAGVATSPSTATLAVGSHIVTATYSGNGDFNSIVSPNFTQTVDLAGTTTTVASAPVSSTYGQTVVFTAVVAPIAPGAGVPAGTVVFTLDGAAQPAVALDGTGQATLTPPPLAAGAHTLTADYSGSAWFAVSSGTLAGGHTVNQSPTTTALASSQNPAIYGQAVVFTATVAPVGPGAGVPTGTVTFTLDGTAQPPVTVDGTGQATFAPPPLAVGNHTLTADYSGDANFAASSGALAGGQNVNLAASSTVVLSSLNPAVYGQSVVFTATVAPVAPATGTPTGVVTFTLDGVAQAPVALNGAGQAALNPGILNAGTHTLAAAYSGDVHFAASNGALALDQVITPAGTATAVASSLNPSTYGQSVTFTATVTPVAPGAGVPVGSVTFTVDGVAQPAASLDGLGQATLNTTALGAGPHTVTANFGGSANFGASNGTLGGGQAVNQAATSTTVVTSGTPTVFGQTVAFTATVTAVAPGAGVPVGNVTFNFDGVPQTPVPLDGAGQATLATSGLSVAPHVITADFGGNTNYGASAATVAGGQTVNAADTTTTAVSSSWNPSNLGLTVTFNVTVAAVAPGAGTPTGTVDFLDGGVAIGNVALDAGGVATFSTAALATGNHTMTAAYLGSASYNPSNSAAPDLVQTVNDAPTANPQNLSTAEDTPVAITLTGFNPSGGPLTFAVTSQPAHGTLSGTAPNVLYTPAADYNGPDSFTFTVSTGTATSTPAAISLTVTAVNDQPLATAQAVTAAEDTPLAIVLGGADGDPEVAQTLTFAIAAAPAHGTLSGFNAATGAVTYTPALNYLGADSFTFTVTDDGTAGPTASLTSAEATVAIAVTGTNDAPVASAQNVVTGVGIPVTITLAGSDTENDPLTFAAASQPANGTLSGDPQKPTYTPAAGFAGTDSFTFTANDGQLTSAPATVTITVTALPTFQSEPVLTPAAVVAGQPVLMQASADTPDIAWDFGDGTGAAGAGATHVYTQPGIYTVTVTATSAQGAASVYTTQLFVGLPATGDSPTGTVGGAALPPGASGLLVGSGGIGTKQGGSCKMTVNYAKRERSAISGSVGTIALPAGLQQAALMDQQLILTLGSGATTQTFTCVLNKSGRGKGVSLQSAQFSVKKARFKFKVNNQPALVDTVEALGGTFLRDSRQGPVLQKLLPGTLQIGNSIFVAMTFKVEYVRVKDMGRGKTVK
jgi:autotransporter-associated beta strand protein